MDIKPEVNKLIDRHENLKKIYQKILERLGTVISSYPDIISIYEFINEIDGLLVSINKELVDEMSKLYNDAKQPNYDNNIYIINMRNKILEDMETITKILNNLRDLMQQVSPAITNLPPSSSGPSPPEPSQPKGQGYHELGELLDIYGRLKKTGAYLM